VNIRPIWGGGVKSTGLQAPDRPSRRRENTQSFSKHNYGNGSSGPVDRTRRVASLSVADRWLLAFWGVCWAGLFRTGFAFKRRSAARPRDTASINSQFLAAM
jgi:hypothetical protein